MQHYTLMVRIAGLLHSAGLEAITPDPDRMATNRTTETAARRKGTASRRHMAHIRHRNTAAVLVVNLDRPGSKNYIGPSTFAEIGVAFSRHRTVFLLQDMPATYAEELTAWGVQCLNWDIRHLLEKLSAPNQITPTDCAAIRHIQA
jgi:nucleoside 2-deoxyribosyltransferase